MLNLQTKFEMSTFIRSKDTAWPPGPQNVEIGHKANILHVANQYTKFEVSSFSRSTVPEIF